MRMLTLTVIVAVTLSLWCQPIVAQDGLLAVEPEGGLTSESLLFEINRRRADAGLPKLLLDERISVLARDIVTKVSAGEVPLSSAEIRGQRAAERANTLSGIFGAGTRVEENFQPTGTPESVTTQWMRSDNERARMLGDFSLVGIGIAAGQSRDAESGTTKATPLYGVIFVKPADPNFPAAPPRTAVPHPGVVQGKLVAVEPDRGLLSELLAFEINLRRSGSNLPPLAVDERISAEARDIASKVSAGEVPLSSAEIRGQRAIERAQRLSSIFGAGTSVEENFQPTGTPESIATQWLRSENERARMLGDFTHMGFGIAADAQGKPFYGVIFIKPGDPNFPPLPEREMTPREQAQLAGNTPSPSAAGPTNAENTGAPKFPFLASSVDGKNKSLKLKNVRWPAVDVFLLDGTGREVQQFTLSQGGERSIDAHVGQIWRFRAGERRQSLLIDESSPEEFEIRLSGVTNFQTLVTNSLQGIWADPATGSLYAIEGGETAGFTDHLGRQQFVFASSVQPLSNPQSKRLMYFVDHEVLRYGFSGSAEPAADGTLTLTENAQALTLHPVLPNLQNELQLFNVGSSTWLDVTANVELTDYSFTTKSEQDRATRFRITRSDKGGFRIRLAGSSANGMLFLTADPPRQGLRLAPYEDTPQQRFDFVWNRGDLRIRSLAAPLFATVHEGQMNLEPDSNGAIQQWSAARSAAPQTKPAVSFSQQGEEVGPAKRDLGPELREATRAKILQLLGVNIDSQRSGTPLTFEMICPLEAPSGDVQRIFDIYKDAAQSTAFVNEWSNSGNVKVETALNTLWNTVNNHSAWTALEAKDERWFPIRRDLDQRILRSARARDAFVARCQQLETETYQAVDLAATEADIIRAFLLKDQEEFIEAEPVDTVGLLLESAGVVGSALGDADIPGVGTVVAIVSLGVHIADETSKKPQANALFQMSHFDKTTAGLKSRYLTGGEYLALTLREIRKLGVSDPAVFAKILEPAQPESQRSGAGPAETAVEGEFPRTLEFINNTLGSVSINWMRRGDANKDGRRDEQVLKVLAAGQTAKVETYYGARLIIRDASNTDQVLRDFVVDSAGRIPIDLTQPRAAIPDEDVYDTFRNDLKLVFRRLTWKTFLPLGAYAFGFSDVTSAIEKSDQSEADFKEPESNDWEVGYDPGGLSQLNDPAEGTRYYLYFGDAKIVEFDSSWNGFANPALDEGKFTPVAINDDNLPTFIGLWEVFSPREVFEILMHAGRVYKYKIDVPTDFINRTRKHVDWVFDVPDKSQILGDSRMTFATKSRQQFDGKGAELNPIFSEGRRNVRGKPCVIEVEYYFIVGNPADDPGDNVEIEGEINTNLVQLGESTMLEKFTVDQDLKEKSGPVPVINHADGKAAKFQISVPPGAFNAGHIIVSGKLKETDSSSKDDDLGGRSEFIYWRTFDYGTTRIVPFETGDPTYGLKIWVWVKLRRVPEA